MKCLAIDETPDLIDKSLHELQTEIDYKIPDLRKNAYLHRGRYKNEEHMRKYPVQNHVSISYYVYHI